MSAKIRVRDTFGMVSPSEGLDQLLSVLQSAKSAEASGEWENIEVSSACSYDSCYNELEIIGYRWETDKEHAKRVKALEKAATLRKKQKQVKAADEKKLYEKLKKKYGDAK